MLARTLRWSVAALAVVVVVALCLSALPNAASATSLSAPAPAFATPSKATAESTLTAIRAWLVAEKERLALHWPSLPSIETGLELFGVAAALCAVATVAEPETLGAAAVFILPCLGAAAAFGGYVEWALHNGGSGAPASGSSALSVQSLSIFNAHWYSTAINGLDTDTGTIGSLLNLSAPYFAEQAESAALTQLGNSTWNPLLDAAQSDVGVELGGVVLAAQESAAAILALATNSEQTELGSENPALYSCNFNLTAGPGASGSVNLPDIGAVANNGNDCPTAAPSTYYYFAGQFVSTQAYLVDTAPTCDGPTSTSALWINTSFPVVFSTDASPLSLALYNVINGSIYDAMVGPSGMSHAGSQAFVANLTGIPTGDYYVCSLEDPFVIVPLVGTALGNESLNLLQFETIANADALLPNPAPLYTDSPTTWLLLNNASSDYIWQTAQNGETALTQPNATWTFNGGSETYIQQIDGLKYSSASGNHSATFLNQLPYWASTVLTAAETEAHAYWSFLRGAGFHSAGAVPAQCAIPPPSALLPPTLPPSEVAQLNYTTVENLYLAVLNGIGQSYGGTSIDWTDCVADGLGGLPYPPTGGSGNWTSGNSGVNGTSIDALGVYALGYMTDAQGGSGTRVFTNPLTWVDYGQRYEGLFFIAPTIHDVTLTVGKINRLPGYTTENPLNVWVQPLYASDPSESLPFYLNWSGPTYCSEVGFPHSGCNTTPVEHYLYPVAGNSTQANSSVYPADGDGSLGTDVFSLAVTACMVATGANATGVPTFSMINTTGAACEFKIGHINASPWNVTCHGTVAANCEGGIGPILTGPTYGDCSILSGVATYLGNFLSTIHYIGGFLASLACPFAWAIVIVIGVAVAVAVWREV